MANTYTQIYIQFVFVVKYRKAMIRLEWKSDLYKYMTGIIQNHGNKVLAINGVEDHVHVFVSLKPDQSISDLARDIKRSSSIWLNEHKYKTGQFKWQKGFGAFSYSKSHQDRVIKYILNQEEHHKKKLFREEYLEFLKSYEVDYNEAYVFKDPE